LAPPNDDHGCDWKEYARHLAEQLAVLKAQVEKLEREKFGSKSEKMGKMPPVPRPAKDPQETAAFRKALALLRVERVETDERPPIVVPEADKKCTVCGGTNFRPVGEGKTCTIYEYVPGYLRRVVLTRETVACRCGECVITAPAPPRWSDQTQYASSFVAHLIVSKCLTVTPLYRMEQAFARTGMPIARSTMNDLFRRGAQKLEPLRDPLFAEIALDYLVHADETTFKMTKQASKAYMWTFVGSQLAGYQFDLTRSGDVPSAVLGTSEGALLCDDYRGYDPAIRNGRRIRCGCHAHARRKYFEAGEIPEATEALELFAGLYAVEHEAERLKVRKTAEHLALRRAYARPLFIRLLLLARELKRVHGPKTLLGRAARYTWRNQRELGRFLHDVRIPLDNNLAENALRVVALGRKNFLFVHSEAAGKELALLYSLAVSCSRLDVNPVDYFTDVLNRIDDTPRSKLIDLLPHRWKPLPAAAAIDF
jgi:transposase